MFNSHHICDLEAKGCSFAPGAVDMATALMRMTEISLSAEYLLRENGYENRDREMEKRQHVKIHNK
jgi:hypothetical protein